MKTIARHALLCISISLLYLTLPLVVSAQEGGGGPALPPAPQVAAPIYETRCANCHGPSGQGDGPQALQVGLAMPDLTDPGLVREATPAGWFDVISNGVEGAAMPPFGEASSAPLRPIDRWNLVFYLYTLSTPPEQVAMGQALYERHCAECHAADGRGGADAPGFVDLAKMAGLSQVDLFVAASDADVQGHDLGLGDVELWTIVDYVRTFSYNYAPPAEGEAPAAASPFTGGEGVVAGQVINGSAGAAPPDGLEIRLRAFDMNADFVDAITATTAADGSFRFEGIDPSAPVQLEPRTVYHDVAYFGDLEAAILLSPEQPQADVDITVYETTKDPSAVRLERLHIIFEFTQLDQVQVAELYILSNDGDRVYVGTLEEGTIRFTEPEGALSFQPGGDPNRYLALADGIADTVPVPPGQGTAQSVLGYSLAYDGELELSRPLPFDVSVINIFVPDVGIEVSGEGIRPGGPFQTQGVTLLTFLADDMPAGKKLTFRVTGQPEAGDVPLGPSPHRPGGPSDAQSLVIGLVVLLAALVVTFLYWQGRLSLNLRPATLAPKSTLLQTIASLDDDFEAGRIKEKRYRAERGRLKQALIELMQEENK